MTNSINNHHVKSSSTNWSRVDGGDDQLDLSLSSGVSLDLMMDDIIALPLLSHPSTMSFEVPFQDPRLEPRPVEAIIASKDHLPSLHTSTLTIDLSSLMNQQDTCEPHVNNDGDDPSSARFRPSQENAWTSRKLLDTTPSLHTNTSTIALSLMNPSKHFGARPDAGSTPPTTRRINQQDTCEKPHVNNNGDDPSSARFRPSQENAWTSNYQRLLRFRNNYGHCCVPHSYSEDPVLARWTRRQRTQYKKLKEGDPRSTLTPHRLEMLASVGFVWCAHAAAWMEKLNELKDFKEIKGHCNVPSIYHENQPLSTWVKGQRRQYKNFKAGKRTPLTMERYRTLESLGFVFEPRRPLPAPMNAEEPERQESSNVYNEFL